MKVFKPRGAVPVAVQGLQRNRLSISRPKTQTVMETSKKHHHHHHRHKHNRHRSLSPAVHANVPGNRTSMSAFPPDQHYYHNNQDTHPYSSSRPTGERTVPISMPAYATDPRATAYWASAGHGNYSTRQRAGTHSGAKHLAPPSSSSSLQYGQPAASAGSSSRHNAPVIHNSMGRTASPHGYDQGYYLSPSSPNAPRREQRKRYSVEAGYPSKYPEGSTYQDPYAGDGYDRRDYQNSSIGGSRKGYHLTGPSVRAQDYDDDYYSYTDAAGMYRDTEPPRWRPRSGSVDRGPQQPRSLYDTYGPRELGPPPTNRRFDRLNESYQGPRGPRDVVAPPNRKTNVRSTYPVDDPYADSARVSSRRQPAFRQDIDDRSYDPRTADDFHNALPRHERGADGDSIGYRSYKTKKDGSEQQTRHRDAYDDDSSYKVTDRRDRRVQPPEANNDDRKDRSARRQPEIVREPEDTRPDNSEAYSSTYDSRRRDRYDEHDRDRRRDVYNHRSDGSHPHKTFPVAAGAAGLAGAGLAAKAGIAASSKSEDSIDQRRGADPKNYKREQEREAEPERVYDKDRYDDKFEEPDRRKIVDRDERGSPNGAEYRERHYVDDTPERENEGHKRDPHLVDDPDEDYRRRVQREIERNRPEPESHHSNSPPSGKSDSKAPENVPATGVSDADSTAIAITAPSDSSSASDPDSAAASRHHHRHPKDDNLASSSSSSTRENRVRIMPPTKHSRSRRNSSPPDPANVPATKGILRKPTEKFPEDPNPVLEGVAPLKDASKKKGIPPDARWTKIARRMVNPEALEEAKERFVEREDCVIVLRVLTKEEIQKFATRTAELRGK